MSRASLAKESTAKDSERSYPSESIGDEDTKRKDSASQLSTRSTYCQRQVFIIKNIISKDNAKNIFWSKHADFEIDGMLNKGNAHNSFAQ